MHLPLLTSQAWFIRLVSVTWHWHYPLLLWWKLPAGTFTIIWSPSGWKHQTDTYIHTLSHTQSSISSHSHWACARGQVSLLLPPLWKDLSPRGLSCLVGQRGKRLCKPAKWGTGLGMHKANPSTHRSKHTCKRASTHTRTHTGSLHEHRLFQSMPICSLWSLSACQDLHKEINLSGEKNHINKHMNHTNPYGTTWYHCLAWSNVHTKHSQLYIGNNWLQHLQYCNH